MTPPLWYSLLLSIALVHGRRGLGRSGLLGRGRIGAAGRVTP
jgi:hypothetical protein